MQDAHFARQRRKRQAVNLSDIRMTAIRAVLDAMYFSGTHRWSEHLFGGMGAILMFHRVRPSVDAAFQPNAFLEITPNFLEEIIAAMSRRGIAFLSLDEACRRIKTGRSADRFVTFTFDDGYRDNLEFAWPILRRNEVPFTIYVTSDFADGNGSLWWLALESAITDNDALTLTIEGNAVELDCPTADDKVSAYKRALDLLAGTTAEAAKVAVDDMASRYGIDLAAQCRAACMDWEELSSMSEDKLVTIGAHTRTHPILARLNSIEVENELSVSTRRITEKLDVEPLHLAYPHGGPNEAGPREFEIAARLGFRSAVTTRPGVIFPEHASYMTALPRISVNGELQKQRYLDVLLSGAPTTLKNGFRRINAA